MPRASLLAVALTLIACSDRGAGDPQSLKDEMAVTTSAASAPLSPEPAMDAAATVGRAANQGAPAQAVGPAVTSSAMDTSSVRAPSMIIRTGSASVQVDDVDTAAAQVRALATRLGGYVANSSFEGGEHRVRSANFELKLPSMRYDDAVSGLKAIGKVESVNTSSEDVGEEFVDLTARVANSRRLEQRLIQLLATRTGKLEDVLAVEGELARVREEVERIEGRLRYLRTRVALSTLVVTVHEEAPIIGRGSDNPIVAALKEAWRNFVRFIAGLIASLGVLIPLAAIGFGGFLVYRKYRRRA